MRSLAPRLLGPFCVLLCLFGWTTPGVAQSDGPPPPPSLDLGCVLVPGVFKGEGTIEVLLTSPVTEAQVVVGKFAAAMLFYVALWLPTVLYVLVLMRHSEIDLGPVLAGYFGVLLLGFLFLAVGTFASTLTDNQLIAAIIAFAAMVALFSIGLVEQLIMSSDIKAVLGHMNLWTQMDDFAKGIVDTRHVVYQLSVGVLFLFLAAKSLEVKKWR